MLTNKSIWASNLWPCGIWGIVILFDIIHIHLRQLCITVNVETLQCFNLWAIACCHTSALIKIWILTRETAFTDKPWAECWNGYAESFLNISSYTEVVEFQSAVGLTTQLIKDKHLWKVWSGNVKPVIAIASFESWTFLCAFPLSFVAKMDIGEGGSSYQSWQQTYALALKNAKHRSLLDKNQRRLVCVHMCVRQRQGKQAELCPPRLWIIISELCWYSLFMPHSPHCFLLTWAQYKSGCDRQAAPFLEAGTARGTATGCILGPHPPPPPLCLANRCDLLSVVTPPPNTASKIPAVGLRPLKPSNMLNHYINYSLLHTLSLYWSVALTGTSALIVWGHQNW